MSKKKGLSRDDKKIKILEIFHEKKEPFAIPDLEPYAKKKGVVVQTVKEIVQELADDGELLFDKIGVTTFYWSFPSQVANSKRLKIQELQNSVEKHKKQFEVLEAEKLKLQSLRADSEERAQKLMKLQELKRQNHLLKEELQRHADSDPAVIDALTADARDAAYAANRWADNIDSLRSWAKKLLMIKQEDFDRQFEVPEEFPYLAPDE